MGQAGEREGGAGEAGAAAAPGAGGPGAGHRAQQGRHARRLGARPQRGRDGPGAPEPAEEAPVCLYTHARTHARTLTAAPGSRCDTPRPRFRPALAGRRASGSGGSPGRGAGEASPPRGSTRFLRRPERRAVTPSFSLLLAPAPGRTPPLPPHASLTPPPPTDVWAMYASVV